MGPLIEGIGLNLTVLSNMGNVDFGVIACRELVPDVWDIADGFAEAVLLLKKAAEELTGEHETTATRTTTPAPAEAAAKKPATKRAPAKQTAAKKAAAKGSVARGASKRAAATKRTAATKRAPRSS
jgi:hypothetical protein